MASSIRVNTKRAEVSGMPELKARLEEMLKIGDVKSRKPLALAVLGALKETAEDEIADQARQTGRGKNVPQEVINSIFTDARVSGSKYNNPRVLTGVNKQRTMRTWTATDNPKSANAKVGAGGKVAMSLAAIFEFGTSKMAPRAFIRPALVKARATIMAKLATRLREVIHNFAR